MHRFISGLMLLLGAIFLGVGIPMFWLWAGSQVQGLSGEQVLQGRAVLVILAGLALTYLGLLFLFSWLKERKRQSSKPTRFVWNRSLRDAPPESEQLTFEDRLVVLTAVLTLIGFLVWFFGFAGSPLPQ